MAPVSRLRQSVVQPAHDLARLDVDRVLIAESPALDTQDEAEGFDVVRQFGQRKRGGLVLVEIAKFERLEVADQNVPGPLALAQRIEIRCGLFVRPREVAPSALLLDNQDARPKEVDVPRMVVQLRDMCFIACDGSPPDAEDLEELVVEALGFAFLV